LQQLFVYFAEHHHPQPAIADRQGFLPLLGGSVVPEFQGLGKGNKGGN
jgi:hypothetical protein